MDNDKKRSVKRRLGAGKEMLARFKACRNQNLEQGQTEASDDELHNDETFDSSLKDTTQSSVSASEGEVDGDIEITAGRVAELQEQLQGKQAEIESLSAEMENTRAEESSPNSSHNSGTHYRDELLMYKAKLGEFEEAVLERDKVIQHLTSMLEDTITARNTLKAQITAQTSVPPVQDPTGPLDAQKRIEDLEQAYTCQEEALKHLNSELDQANQHVKTLESEKNNQATEITDYKANIAELVAQIDKITRSTEGVIAKFAVETKSKTEEHERKIRELETKHGEEMAELKRTYNEQYNKLFERYNTELPALERKHAKELHVFQSQLAGYKKTCESLKSAIEQGRPEQTSAESNNLKMRLLQSEQDKKLLHEQIDVYKQQLQDITAQCVAVTSVLNSKESIEKSLEEALISVETLKRENDALKFQYDDLSARYAASQALIENNAVNERRMGSKIFDLEKSLSRLSGMSLSSEMNTTSYQTFDENAIQAHFIKQLDGKEKIETKLIERIRELEQTIEQSNEALQAANTEKKAFEKQLKDMRNRYDKLVTELDATKTSGSAVQPFPSSLYFSGDTSKLELSEKSSSQSTLIQSDISNDLIEDRSDELMQLRDLVQRREEELAATSEKLREALERVKEYKNERDHLKMGLSNAWGACTDLQTRLNQTLSQDESCIQELSTLNLSTSINADDSTPSGEKLDTSDFPGNLSDIKEKLEYLCTRSETMEQENRALKEENAALLKMQENFAALKKSLDELNAEKMLLVQEISCLTEKHRKELSNVKSKSLLEKTETQSSANSCTELELAKAEWDQRHAKEMEELRTYFEAKCLQMEKQYSEEIFSQSKKVSEDSETDEMTDDLYFGGGGDCLNVSRGSTNNSKGDVPSNELEKQPKATVNVDQLCQTEWDVAGDNGELSELRAAYNDQLKEQIALAKCDILNALQEQIQTLLVMEDDTAENWPAELLELRNKFTNNTKREMEKLREDHSREIAQLKEEHSRAFARTIERHQDEINKLISPTDGQTSEAAPTRDLCKTCVVMKGLINELVKYFATCEEELNNTLISEVLKRQSLPLEQENSVEAEREIVEKENNSSAVTASPTSPKMRIKRVHFAPQSSQISRMLGRDTGVLFELIEEENQIALELRSELEKCLQRMKNDSAQIFGVPLTPGETMLDTLSKQVAWTTKINEELSLKLAEAENTVEEYQEESQQLKLKIADLQQKLIAIDTKKEVISEGYGEQDETASEIVIQDLSELQEKARLAVMNGVGDNANLLQIIEELCRYHDKRIEEVKKEKEDLQLQIEAADKQLRATRKFLEEQAIEREVERDDAARQIDSLHEQLKERERDKERDLRITFEPSPSLSPEPPSANPLLQMSERAPAVEALEGQVREMSSIIADLEEKKSSVETELRNAVAKIWDLREIIVDLEHQIQSKNEKEEVLENKIDQMQERINSQTRYQQDLVQELEIIKMGGEDSQLADHISHLQEELRKHKLSSEHFNVNSTALKQMKLELREMQAHLDKRIKELEAFHMCGSNLSISQPSEDVSIRDQIDATRCPTPDDPNSPPTLPLDQLLKLKEKLLKHTRAEEVAFKRIKDLEMQLSTLKIQHEELQAEQEILQQTASEQLFQLQAARGRLEQQKQSAPFIQQQATSRLEIQLHEANSKIKSLEQAISNKNIEVEDMRHQIERANSLLYAKQQEITNVVQTENNIIQDLKDRLAILTQEKQALESKLNTHERVQKIPQLLDSMLADKNEEIDHLKEQLSKKESQLQALTSLNIEENHLGKQCEPKNSARTLSDILSIHSECEEVSEAIRDASTMHNVPINMSTLKASPVTMKDRLDGSSVPLIEMQKSQNVPLLELPSFGSPSHSSQPHMSLSSDQTKSELCLPKTPIGCSTAMEFTAASSAKVRTFDPKKAETHVPVRSINSPRIEDLENQLKAIHQELQTKSATLSKRELELETMQKSLDGLRAEFKDSIDTLKQDIIFYKNQYELCQESEGKIKRDLEEVEDCLKIRTEELEICQEKMQSNERILLDLTKENSELTSNIDKLREENATLKITIREKSRELTKLEEILFEKDITIETIKTRNQEIENENKQLYEFKTKFENSKRELFESSNEIKRLTDGISHRDEQIRRLEEMARRTSSGGSSSNDHEIFHLQECLKEKEKVIREMSEDSKSLHRSLETIRNKMKESGNVEELRRKLRKARIDNGELTALVAKLQQDLEAFKDNSIHETEGHDIEDMVQRELNLSADLDKKIMDAIESETEEISSRKIEMHSCNSLTIKPVEQDLERMMQQATDVRRKLKHANKQNETLTRQKDELEIERDMLKAQITEYEDRILQIKLDLDRETKKNSEASERMVRAKAKIRELENRLSKEKHATQSIQLQDSELISTLRMKLTSSLKAEEQLRETLAVLREQHRLLQNKLSRRGQSSDAPVSPETENPDVNPLLLAEKYEKASRELVEMSDNMKTVETEKKRLERELGTQLDERESLLSKIALVEGEREHLAADLKNTKEELKASLEECKFLQKRVNTMVKAEEKRQKGRDSELAEVKHLRVELEQVRGVIQDLEADAEELKRQLSVAETEVASLRKNDEQLRRQLKSAQTEEEMLKSMISRYSEAKAILHDKLVRARADNEHKDMQIKQMEARVSSQDVRGVDYVDPSAITKLQQLYAKYIRVDSKRRALIYQKRYLLCVIGCYQMYESENNTLSVLAQLTTAERSYVSEQTLNSVWRTPKARVRRAFLSVIAIVRMKWLVQRWRTGLRGCVPTVNEYDEPHSPIRRPPNHSPPVRQRRNPFENGNYENVDYRHYVQRVSSIQQGLGLALSTEPKPNQMPSE